MRWVSPPRPMRTEQVVVSDMALTKVTPFMSHHMLYDTPFPWKPCPPSPLHPISLDLHSEFSHSMLVPELLAELHYPSTQASLDFRQGENGYTMSADYPSGRDTRPSILLDTRKWSPSPSFVTLYSPSGSHLPLIDVNSHAPLSRFAGGSDGFTEFFSFNGTLAQDVGLVSQAIPHTQPAPDLGSGFSGLVGYHHENICTNPQYSTCPENSMLLFPSSSTEDHASFFGNEAQPPVALYRPQKKNGSGRRRCRHASAINVDGLWVDKDDLYSIVSQGSSVIRVHECQWAKYNNPCGMWILGSRSRVGAHVRKWHRRTHVDSGARCLWDGCTAKVMLKDSISRHVVTVHLGEGFHCEGCGQEFSRKDVYDEHVQKDELCRDAGAVMVYGTECRVIDASKALQQGGGVFHAE